MTSLLLLNRLPDGGSALSGLQRRGFPGRTRRRGILSGSATGVLTVFHLIKTLGDNVQPLADLRLFNSERNEDAQHVVVRPTGEQDQTFIAGALDDLCRQFC